MGDTVWLGVVDQAGNAVSLIQSIYHDFGSAIVPAGTGVLLQNRGCFFSLEPSHVNRLEPGKRTFHTLNPAMLFRGGKPFLIYGTMGGEGQPQTQTAIVTRIVDHKLSPQDAIEAPRWLYGRSWGVPTNNVKLESRIPEDVADTLRRQGHSIEIVEPYAAYHGPCRRHPHRPANSAALWCQRPAQRRNGRLPLNGKPEDERLSNGSHRLQRIAATLAGCFVRPLRTL